MLVPLCQFITSYRVYNTVNKHIVALYGDPCLTVNNGDSDSLVLLNFTIISTN